MIVPTDNTWKASQEPAAGCDKPGFDDSAWPVAQEGGSPTGGGPPLADLARIPAPYLRKGFSVDKAVKRAMVYVTALGTYELRLNGKRVSKDVFAPGWTEFRKRVHYQTYDVTAQVEKGKNAIGAILGDGWYASDLAHLGGRNLYGGRPRFLAQLVIELADGTIYTAALRSAPATDFFILSGKGEQVLEPYFTFHGFRYVEVRGLTKRPDVGAVTGLVVHTPMKRTGSFECSYPLFGGFHPHVWYKHGGEIVRHNIMSDAEYHPAGDSKPWNSPHGGERRRPAGWLRHPAAIHCAGADPAKAAHLGDAHWVVRNLIFSYASHMHVRQDGGAPQRIFALYINLTQTQT